MLCTVKSPANVLLVLFNRGMVQVKMSATQLFLLFCSLTLLLWPPMVHLHHSNDELNKTTAGGIRQYYKDNDLATNDAAYLNLKSKPDLDEDACQKTWIFGSNGTCQCGPSVRGSVSCSNISNRVAILRCHCMTYDSKKGVVLGNCPYGCGYFNDSSSWSGREVYHPLLLNIMDLNHEMCGRFNRDFRLCSKCIEGFSPLVYSYDLNCVKCSGEYNWLKYVAVAYIIPLTVFYLVVILLRIDATEPYLYGFIMLNQGLASPTSLRAVFITVIGKSVLVLRIIAIP